jgi:tetratricopeptide (TPR) repeat protein
MKTITLHIAVFTAALFSPAFAQTSGLVVADPVVSVPPVVVSVPSITVESPVIPPDVVANLSEAQAAIESIEPQIALDVEEAARDAEEQVKRIQPGLDDRVRVQINQNMKEVDSRIRPRMDRMHQQFAFNMPRLRGFVSGGWEGGEFEENYRSGTRAIDRHDYEKAIAQMDQVIAAKGNRTDGAYYWKAYAQAKLGRTSDALRTLDELQRNYPKSAWLNDAKALAVETRQQAGQPVSPETEGNDDLKLLAINGLMKSDPSRAMPLVEKLLNDPNNAPKLRERALFVLSRSNAPEARQTVARLAEGSSNPDLQIKAIQYLGISDSKENAALFPELYRRSTDNAVKRAVLQTMFVRKDRATLVNIAKTEQNPDLRRQAIQFLGAMGATDALAGLYTSESSEEGKRAIIDSLFAQGDAKQLVDIARHESNPKLKRSVVERLSAMNSKESNEYMLELLRK